MARLVRYAPQSVMIPPQIAARRGDLLRNAVDTYPADQAIDGGYALFHDVFRTVGDDKIIALGSGWRDAALTPIFGDDLVIADWRAHSYAPMKDDLTPRGVFHNGQALKMSYRSLYGLQSSRKKQIYAPVAGIYEIEMTDALKRQPRAEIEFVWNDFKAALSVPRNPFAERARADLTLQASQRGNHPLWVSDWCRYHYYEHQITRIAIYDNLDAASDEIFEALKGLPDGLEVIYIDWPYRYNYEVYFNQAQVISLNHCPLILGATGDYYINLDFDEYLVNRSGAALARALDAQMAGRFGQAHAVALRQCPVPNFSAAPAAKAKADRVARVWDFERALYKTYSTAPKTIHKYGRFECVWQHSATPLWPARLKFLLRFRLARAALENLGAILPFIRYTRPQRGGAFLSLARRALSRGARTPLLNRVARPLLERFDRRALIFPDLFFYHYAALGSNWNKRRGGKSDSIDAATFIPMAHRISKSQIYKD